METVSVGGHQKNNNGCMRNQSFRLAKFASFGSLSVDDFQGINYWAFQSGAGILPTPYNSLSQAKPIAKNTSFSPKTPSPSPFSSEQVGKDSKRFVKSSSVPIPIKIEFEHEGDNCFSELWAGPTYSNSPPPSSLPLPKFSMRPKSTVSLELPGSSSPEVDLQLFSKSAPASPARERSSLPSGMSYRGGAAITNTFSSLGLADGADSATKTLCRILNLEITND